MSLIPLLDSPVTDGPAQDYTYEELILPAGNKDEDRIHLNHDPGYVRRYVLLRGKETLAFMIKRKVEGKGRSGATWARWENVALIRVSTKLRGSTGRKINVYAQYLKGNKKWTPFQNSTNNVSKLDLIVPDTFTPIILKAIDDLYRSTIGVPSVNLVDYSPKEVGVKAWSYLTHLAYPATKDMACVPSKYSGLVVPSSLTLMARSPSFEAFAVELVGRNNFSPDLLPSLKVAAPFTYETVLAFKNLVPASDLKDYIKGARSFAQSPLRESGRIFDTALYRRTLKMVDSRKLVALLKYVPLPSSKLSDSLFSNMQTLNQMGYSFKPDKVLYPNDWAQLNQTLAHQVISYEQNVLVKSDLSSDDLTTEVNQLGLDSRFYWSAPGNFKVLLAEKNSLTIFRTERTHFGGTLYSNGIIARVPGRADRRVSKQEILNYVVQLVDIATDNLTSVKAVPSSENISTFIIAALGSHLTGSPDWGPNIFRGQKNWWGSSTKQALVAKLIRDSFELKEILTLCHLPVNLSEAKAYQGLPVEYIMRMNPKNFYLLNKLGNLF